MRSFLISEQVVHEELGFERLSFFIVVPCILIN